MTSNQMIQTRHQSTVISPRPASRVRSLLGGFRHLRLAALSAALALATGNVSAQSVDPLAVAQEGFDHPVKFAIYSAAWHLSSNAGLRVVAQNQGKEAVELRSVVFRNEIGNGNNVELELNMNIAPGKWAELQLPYVDLLAGNECVQRTMQDDWKLVEISNYTLNPSVRGLIIENTRSFRIYQCVRSVRTTWVYAGSSQEGGNERTDSQWLMYHFERLPLD